MKLENVETKDNPLLGRTEVTARVTFTEATPSRSDLIKAIAAQTKSKEDLVIVKSLEGNYGGGSAELIAHTYKDRAVLEKVEREYMRTRNVVKEEEKPEEPAAEEAPAAEEKPAEEATEEKSEEAPTEAPAEEKKEEGE